MKLSLDGVKKMHAVLSADPHYLAKSEKTRLRIVEQALKVIADRGLEQASFAALAEEIGVSRPLITHYFSKKEELFVEVIHFSVANAQIHVGSAFDETKSALKNINSYVKSNFEWAKKFPDHLKMWMAFLYHCTFNPEYLKFNSEVREIGRSRLKSFVDRGIKNREASNLDSEYIASVLYNQVVHLVISSVTQNGVDIRNYRALRKLTRELLKTES
ncbi:MAG: hypothetical protein COT74_06170 [Bdellovibrionales bacterium CG10_big_fil_rev_8_21_14_0_10_45_34]|nr:MAG: hypothetical protein COT74_06170 [Bdellovibrionales bacterium CG10_big_fil_rev_8_21_14_0_10_45_34]